MKTPCSALEGLRRCTVSLVATERVPQLAPVPVPASMLQVTPLRKPWQHNHLQAQRPDHSLGLPFRLLPTQCGPMPLPMWDAVGRLSWHHLKTHHILGHQRNTLHGWRIPLQPLRLASRKAPPPALLYTDPLQANGHLVAMAASFGSGHGSRASNSALYQECSGTMKTPSQTASATTSMPISSQASKIACNLAIESG
eukprot:CAMPEP_0172781514 /NCGR_PEP_ID=MMETSP1074-20121228/203467_1 /TAXON_ID=2916 /ORGANISM="Ceratium fusus, Strain PA161109" /LENGTH=196 /DNA_ID=CAMNT_0013618491 /DNA_START=641 /DNA_END=1231 /DNA_ORIENTATION=-